MNSNPLFSIICPVYNAENTIFDTVQSIINQTFNDWELILVDDGSFDNSSSICDDFANKHSNIRAIHKENAGQARARFDGVFEAKGSYILFLDSDDEYVPDALAFLNNQIKEKQNDIIVFNAISIDSERKQEDVYVLNLDENSSPLVECFCKRRIGYLWSICFKSEILKKVDKSVLEKFFTLRYSEDYYLIYNILKNIKTEQFQMIDEKLYIYKINPLSITNNQNANKLMDRFIATNCILEDMFKNYPSEYKQLSIEEKETAGWT